MGSRLELQALLEGILGSPNVYFQAPNDTSMQYPCIVYQPYKAKSEFADNVPYRMTNAYQVTVIDSDPDSLIPAKVLALPMCLHNRFFVANNLNHNVYNLYY
jgi:hypothetical protein